MCEELEKCNFKIIVKIINDATHLLWPSRVKYDEMLIFITEAVLYYIIWWETINSLNMLFLNLILLAYLTCEI